MERLTAEMLDPYAKEKHFTLKGCPDQCARNCFGCKVLMQAIDRLAAYEDTGLEPEQVLELKSFTQGGIRKADEGWLHVQELLQAEKGGRLVVLDEKIALSMCAGARAIENNKRLFGVIYGYDIFGVRRGPKEISYYEAAKKLREIAEPVLDREEAEAALTWKGDTHETDPV